MHVWHIEVFQTMALFKILNPKHRDDTNWGKLFKTLHTILSFHFLCLMQSHFWELHNFSIHVTTCFFSIYIFIKYVCMIFVFQMMCVFTNHYSAEKKMIFLT